MQLSTDHDLQPLEKSLDFFIDNCQSNYKLTNVNHSHSEIEFMNIKLPDSELEILSLLWRMGKSTTKEIRQTLKPDRDHATISTLLRRLEERKFVRREKVPNRREFVYEAVARPEKTRRALVKNLLQRAFDGSGVELVNALFQTKAPSAKEIEELQTILDKLKGSKKRNSR